MAVLWAIAVQALPAFARDAGGAETAAQTMHRSFLSIPPGTPLPTIRKVTIGVDKSMLLELPVDLENVLVSNPEVLNAVVKSPRQVYLLAKDQGEANAFFMGRNGQKVLLLEVVVARDLSALTEAFRRFLPGSKITVESMGENIVLTGSVMNPADAGRAAEIAGRLIKRKDGRDGREGVVNLLTIAAAAKEQVLLKVTVAEMQRDAMRRLGVDIPNSLAKVGNMTFQKVVTNAFPVTGVAAPLGTAGTALTSTWSAGGDTISVLLNSLERAGMLRTLAEPNLTALTGETAKFLAGGEFPVPVTSKDGEIKVEFKSFGVSTSFKPIVLSDGRISLSIGAEVSELTNEGAVTLNNITISALKVRRAETTLEMPSGSTLAMAGLLSDDTRQSVEGVPALKELPVLGQLFRSNDYRRRETELVILVTPYLAKHMAPHQAGRPDKGFAPTSDLKSLFFGHLNRIYGPIEPDLWGKSEGDYGFIVEYPDPGVKG